MTHVLGVLGHRIVDVAGVAALLLAGLVAFAIWRGGRPFDWREP